MDKKEIIKRINLGDFVSIDYEEGIFNKRVTESIGHIYEVSGNNCKLLERDWAEFLDLPKPSKSEYERRKTIPYKRIKNIYKV